LKKIILFFYLIIFSTASLQAQTPMLEETEVNEWLPTLIGNNNAGTEFYLTFHPSWETGEIDSFLKIYVTSGVATDVKVTVPGKGFEQTQKTLPNEIIVFNLPPNIAQPYSKGDRDKPEDDQVWKRYAIHVEADDPVICYGVSRFPYSSDGYLGIPVHALGKEYVASTWTDISENTSPGGQFLTCYTSAVAAYDNTKVKYTGGGPSYSKTTTGIGVGESKIFDMNKGDVLMMASIESYSDLSGSKFTSNKNIAVISGNFCAYIPEFIAPCDFIIEQDLPMHSWGNTYCVTPIKKKEKNSWIKIYASQPGTQLYRDGIIFGELTKGGGAREGECYLSQRVLDDTQAPRPVVISSNKPISVTQYNTGMNDDGVPSDPFQMVLTPSSQWQNEIIFCTPGYQGDGFNENYLNLVYEIGTDGNIPEDFEFAKVVDGDFEWKKLRDVFPDVGEKFEVLIDGKQYYSKIITLPGDGVYKLKANSTFAAYANGKSSYDSYGYPVSSNLKDKAGVDIEAPNSNPFVDADGIVRQQSSNNVNVPVMDYPEDLEHRSNLARIVFDPYLSRNFTHDVAEFVPGDSRETTWNAEVIDKDKPGVLVVYYVDRSGNTDADTLIYMPKGVEFFVDDYDFETVKENIASMSLPISIYNLGPNTIEIKGFTPTTLRRSSDNKPIFTYEELEDIFEDGKTLTLKSGEIFSFEVTANTDITKILQDSIVFDIGAAIGDNVCLINVLSVTNVDDQLDEALSTYPNPCRGELNVEYNHPEIILHSIDVVDINGKTVLSKSNIMSKSQKLNLEQFSNGTYILRIITNKGKLVRSVILNK
jgi:IgGFc binding protein/type IX secretion system substrate protein